MNTEVDKNDGNITKPGLLGVRHAQALMLALAMAISYAMRVNMSLAIVVMTDATQKKFFDWSVRTQSVILSSFFWGYIVLQIPAGILAARIGSKIPLLSLVTVNSIVSLLVPVAANHGGWKVVCVCRIVQGLSQGFLFPSCHNLLSKWAPLDERSRLGTIVYSGPMIGMTIQYCISGFIASAWGWPAIFYVNAACGATWVAVYAFVGADTPESSRIISLEERLYVQESLGQIGGYKKLKTPWKLIWTSVPFLALIVTHCGQNWGFFTLVTLIPTYMANVLGVNIKENGVLSALPYLAIFVMSFPVGISADWILKKKLLSITNNRKLFNSIAMFGPALALIGLSYTPPGALTLAVVLLMVVVGINAGQVAGFILVHIDMAPNFAGVLMGITNSIANVISIIAPLVAGTIIKDQKNPSDWRTVFFVASAVYIVTNTIFVIYGSSERQTWNDLSEDDDISQVKIEKQV